MSNRICLMAMMSKACLQFKTETCCNQQMSHLEENWLQVQNFGFHCFIVCSYHGNSEIWVVFALCYESIVNAAFSQSHHCCIPNVCSVEWLSECSATSAELGCLTQGHSVFAVPVRSIARKYNFQDAFSFKKIRQTENEALGSILVLMKEASNPLEGAWPSFVPIIHVSVTLIVSVSK